MLGFLNAFDALIKAIKQKPSKLGHIISTLKKEKKKNNLQSNLQRCYKASPWNTAPKKQGWLEFQKSSNYGDVQKV